MSENYLVGQVLRISATVRDASDNLADPGGLVFKFRYGSGPITIKLFGVDPEVVRDGLGRFHIDLPLTDAGVLYFRWESNASNTGAGEGKIAVAAGRFN